MTTFPPAPSIAQPSGGGVYVGKYCYARFICKGVIEDRGRYVAILEPVGADGRSCDSRDPAYYIDTAALIEGKQVQEETA